MLQHVHVGSYVTEPAHPCVKAGQHAQLSADITSTAAMYSRQLHTRQLVDLACSHSVQEIPKVARGFRLLEPGCLHAPCCEGEDVLDLIDLPPSNVMQASAFHCSGCETTLLSLLL